MEIYSANSTFDLVEADVVKAFKTCATNRPYPVIRDQEVLLPTHENIFSLRQARDVEIALPSLLLERAKGREFGPVREISLIR